MNNKLYILLLGITAIFFSACDGNLAPIAVDDYTSTDAHVDIYLDVILNDTDEDTLLDNSSLKIVQAPANGTATITSDFKVMYKSNLDFSGEEKFTYSICDKVEKDVKCDTATIAITVAAVKVVKMVTSSGEMDILLYNNTPKHRDNFLKLTEDGFYHDLLFHRVMPTFMIQAGDPNSKDAEPGQMLGNGGPGYTVDARFLPQNIHKRGALAAARQPDQVNPKKSSSGSQFYIVDGKKYGQAELTAFEGRMGKRFSALQRAAYTSVGGTPQLDGQYTVYGEVIKGFDVIGKIAQVQKDRRNRPNEDIKIISTTVIQ